MEVKEVHVVIKNTSSFVMTVDHENKKVAIDGVYSNGKDEVAFQDAMESAMPYIDSGYIVSVVGEPDILY